MMHLVLIVVIFNESTIAPLNGRYYGLHTVYLQLFTELMDAIGLSARINWASIP